jgi:DNA modification methylase
MASRARALDRPPQNLKSQLGAKSRARRETHASPGASSGFQATNRNDMLPTLAMTEMPIAALRPPAREIRKNDPAHVKEVADSISALGFCVPVLIGKGNVVLDGWTRVEAAKALGLDRAPCVRIGHLTEVEQRLLRIAANRLGEKGEWDLGALKLEFEELILEQAPIEITGFDAAEIDHIVLDDKSQSVETGPLEPEAGAVATATRGDVFALGPHRLICGDATEPADLLKLMGENLLARLLLTDEPYNVPIGGHVSGGQHREFVMASGEMSHAEFLNFNLAWIKAGLAHLCDGGILATFIDWRGFPTVHAAASNLGLAPLNLVVWAKTNAGMGSLFRSQHELLPLFKKGSAPHVNNVELGKRGRWRSNLWTYPGASSLGSDARQGLRDHPTVKPTAMLEDALLDLTKRGDVVLDPFLGFGIDPFGGAQNWPGLPRVGTRSILCRCRGSTTRGRYRPEGATRGDR